MPFHDDVETQFLQSKRRAAVEERLAAKLREEHEKLEAATGKERARRNLRFEIIKKEDERNAFVAIVSLEVGRIESDGSQSVQFEDLFASRADLACISLSLSLSLPLHSLAHLQYRSRRAAKTNLANFLCTTNKHTEAAASAQTLGNLRPAPLPEVPHAFAPSVSASASASSARPLYYLPYKLLPWQADKIDAQVEDMRIELDKEEEAWREELQKRDEEIKELKSKAQEVNAEMARESGEGSRRSRDRRADSAAMDEDLDAQPSLPGRAPLPEREGRVDEDTSEQTRVASDGDATMKSTADGEDVLECECSGARSMSSVAPRNYR